MRLLWVDEEDGEEFADSTIEWQYEDAQGNTPYGPGVEEGCGIYGVSTQLADGIAGNFSMSSASMRGSMRDNVVG